MNDEFGVSYFIPFGSKARLSSAAFDPKGKGLAGSFLGGSATLSALLSPEAVEAGPIITSKIEAPRHPALLEVAEGLEALETPFGSMFETLPLIFRRWAYGEGSSLGEKLAATLEVGL